LDTLDTGLTKTILESVHLFGTATPNLEICHTDYEMKGASYLVPYEVISVENRQKKFQPRVFCAPTETVPHGIGYRNTEKTNQNDGATRWSKMF